MISGNGMHLSSIFSVKAKGVNTYAHVIFNLIIFNTFAKRYFKTFLWDIENKKLFHPFRNKAFRMHCINTILSIKKYSYIGSSPSILTMASLDTDQIIVLSAGVVVFQQSHLPLMFQQKTFW